LTGQCLTLLKRFQGFVEIERLSHLSFLFEIYYWNDTEFLTLPKYSIKSPAFVEKHHLLSGQFDKNWPDGALESSG
ncbi:hypothetical protein EAE92_05265, partial [Photorhabdus hainanensis]|nr:hypothetical protein [Photorhabdus hainanensis]